MQRMIMCSQPTITQSRIRDVTFGECVSIVEPVNLYECTIGDNCFIGPFVEIQKGVVIGKNCKIQSHAFICELVSIGNDCFISHGARFVNDTFKHGRPAGGDRTLWRRVKVGNNVAIGTNATILPVDIADNVVIGAGAVVTRDIVKAGIYAGSPAKFLRPL